MNYLYNGREFPAPPNKWNNETHPYTLIYYNASLDKTWFITLTGPAPYKAYNSIFITGNTTNDLSKGAIYGVRVNESDERLNFLLSDGGWHEDDYSTDIRTWAFGPLVDPGEETQGEVIWSNYDIPNEVDGGIYLAASDPVPVGGVAPDLDPAAFMEGLRIGQIVRAMRL